MSKDLTILKKETVDVVAERINEFRKSNAIHFPQNYSPDNALKSAWLMIQETKDRNDKLALEVCTKESIANALLNMVIQGLSPAKKQIYFIVRGNKLCAERSYHGTQAVTKRLSGVEDIFAQVIYKNDEFEYTIVHGIKKVVKHVQKLENIDNSNIVGAYCTIIYDGGKEFTEIMNKKQIDTSWSKTSMKTNSVQKEFPEEMAKRTVINRACKAFVNTSDDNDLVIEAFHDTSGADFDRNVEEEVSEEIRENANKDVIDVTPVRVESKNSPDANEPDEERPDFE